MPSALPQAGDPGHRSPREVANDPAYEVQVGYRAGNWWPAQEEIVVKHLLSGTFWRALYAMRVDDTDYGERTGWTHVAKREVIVVEFTEVRS